MTRYELLALFRQTHAALHRSWRRAVGAPDYDKADWRAVDNALCTLARQCAESIGYDGPLLGALLGLPPEFRLDLLGYLLAGRTSVDQEGVRSAGAPASAARDLAPREPDDLQDERAHEYDEVARLRVELTNGREEVARLQAALAKVDHELARAGTPTGEQQLGVRWGADYRVRRLAEELSTTKRYLQDVERGQDRAEDEARDLHAENVQAHDALSALGVLSERGGAVLSLADRISLLAGEAHRCDG